MESGKDDICDCKDANFKSFDKIIHIASAENYFQLRIFCMIVVCKCFNLPCNPIDDS